MRVGADCTIKCPFVQYALIRVRKSLSHSSLRKLYNTVLYAWSPHLNLGQFGPTSGSQAQRRQPGAPAHLCPFPEAGPNALPPLLH